MEFTTQRRCLGAIAGGLVIGTAVAIGWSLSAIDASEGVVPSTQQNQALAADTIDTSARPLDAAIASQSLRGPLYDPPPTPPPVEPPRQRPAPPPPRKATLDVTLVGTIIESDQSFAIVADASGKFDVKGVGESLELVPPGITVETIEAERVTLQYQGRQSTVQLDRSMKKGKAAKDGPNRRGKERRRDIP